jgi:hypothetical protein
MSDGETTATALKIGSIVSIALGPVLSRAVPMATDLRPWAFWFSGVVSAATLAWLWIRLSDVTDRRGALRVFRNSCIAAVLFAFAYVAINLIWTIEYGDFRDALWRLGLIGTFGLGTGSVTGALAAGEKVVKSAS